MAELKKTGVQVVNVLQYGADSTGVASSAAAFTAAVAALPASGGVVYFPPGEYKGEMAMTSESNVTILGAGKATKLTGGGAGTNCIDMTSCTNVRVDNVWCYASGSSAAASLAVDNGIYSVSSTNVTITGCDVTNHGFAGLCFSNCSRVTVDGNDISAASGFDTNLSANCSDVFVYGSATITDYIITGNICRSANNVGILIQPVTDIDCRRFTIKGNICTDHIKYGILTYVPMAADDDTTLSEVNIVGNVCENNKYCGIYLNSTRNSTVTGNSTRDNRHSGGDTNNGLVGGIFLNGCSGVVVSGNSIADEYWYGIFVSGHSDRTTMRSNVVIANNVIDGQLNASYPAIFVSLSMTECSVLGNSIRGNGSTGVYIQGTSGQTKKVIVSGNQVDGVSVGATTTRGIDIDGSYNSAVVTGNKVTNYFAGLRFSESNVLLIKNNLLTGNTYDIYPNGTLDDLRMSDNVYATSVGSATITITSLGNGDTTPSVMGRSIVKTANAGATAISALDDGIATQVVTVLIADANTTIDFTGTTLKGNNGSDWTPASGDHMTCTFDGTNWYCNVSEN